MPQDSSFSVGAYDSSLTSTRLWRLPLRQESIRATTSSRSTNLAIIRWQLESTLFLRRWLKTPQLWIKTFSSKVCSSKKHSLRSMNPQALRWQVVSTPSFSSKTLSTLRLCRVCTISSVKVMRTRYEWWLWNRFRGSMCQKQTTSAGKSWKMRFINYVKPTKPIYWNTVLSSSWMTLTSGLRLTLISAFSKSWLPWNLYNWPSRCQSRWELNDLG